MPSASPTAIAACRACSHATRVSGFVRWAMSMSSGSSYVFSGSTLTSVLGSLACSLCTRSAESRGRSGAAHGRLGDGGVLRSGFQAAQPAQSTIRRRRGRDPPRSADHRSAPWCRRTASSARPVASIRGTRTRYRSSRPRPALRRRRWPRVPGTTRRRPPDRRAEPEDPGAERPPFPRCDPPRHRDAPPRRC